MRILSLTKNDARAVGGATLAFLFAVVPPLAALVFHSWWTGLLLSFAGIAIAVVMLRRVLGPLVTAFRERRIYAFATLLISTVIAGWSVASLCLLSYWMVFEW